MPTRAAKHTGAKVPTPGATRAAQDVQGSAGVQTSSASSPADGNSIRVVLRVRPRSERELSQGVRSCVKALGDSTVRVGTAAFSFDHVAGEHADQESLFQHAGRFVVDSCVAGYNGCIFAYGQTGSGKTFTMLGPGEGSEPGGPSDASCGLIQRVFEHLFASITAGGGQHRLECSFLEIYNETINDLVDPSRTNLPIRESPGGQLIPGLSVHPVKRVEDVAALLRKGQANRRVGETNMNERSSRSHSVFTCWLQSRMVNEAGVSVSRTARLHLVDLAGSERQKASGAQGERLKEATAINSSLSALGTVIMRLADRQQGRAQVGHIPYRDSRLTYLLQDSLGGNSKTCLVAHVSPVPECQAETLSTLRFADQAKRIRTQAVSNEYVDDREVLRREVARLQGELAAVRRQPQGQHLMVRRFCCCFLPVRAAGKQVHPLAGDKV